MHRLVASLSSTPVPTAQLAPVDWAVLLAYLVITMVIGFWSMRRISDAGAFLMARRKLGKIMSLAASFAGGVNASDPVQVASKVYRDGASGMWSTLNFLLLTPMFWMREAVGRRLRMVTMIDVWENRFGPILSWFQLVMGVLLGPVNIGLGILAAGKVTLGLAGGHLVAAEGLWGMDQATADIVVATGLVVMPTMIYTVMGGIIAVCATDVFMSLLIVVLSFVTLPFLWSAVGGGAVVAVTVPKGHWQLISQSAGADFSLIGIAWFCITWLVALGGPGPSSARDELTARVGSLGLIFKRVCTLGWAGIGLLGLAYFAKQGIQIPANQTDTVFARVCVQLLPAGLRGVMLAAILAAAMSTIAGMTLGFSAMTLQNFYVRLILPKASPGHYLFTARVLAVLGLALAWVVAVLNANKDLFGYFAAMGLLGAGMSLPYLAAFVWRRVTYGGAIAATIVVLPASLVNLFGGFTTKWTGILALLDPLRRLWMNYLIGWEWLYAQIGGLFASDSWIGLAKVVLTRNAEGLVTGVPIAISTPATLVPGLAALILVSLFTQQHNERKVFEFYARLDTPVGKEQRLRDLGIQVDLLQDLGSDADVDTVRKHESRRLLFLDLLYLPKLFRSKQARISDYRTDLLGIGGSIVFIVAFMFLVRGLIVWLQE